MPRVATLSVIAGMAGVVSILYVANLYEKRESTGVHVEITGCGFLSVPSTVTIGSYARVPIPAFIYVPNVYEVPEIIDTLGGIISEVH